ncbi:MAG: sigma-E processing peptidase SpoIIGA [Oscillospiraceae bacterium]|jgi:hypothetical protein|nr:sigma-E processing peptidase SpoIIGA [Oscillospiraceae bacterium]
MIEIELFFLVNLIMDYYILYLSLKWLDVCRVKVGRLVAASVLGSVYACVGLGFAPFLLTPPIPFAAAVPMIWISVGGKPVKVILKGAGFMLASAFLSAGTIYAVQRVIPQVSFVPLMFASAVVTGVASLMLGRSKKRAAWVMGEVHYRFGDMQGRFDAAVDSGNHAVDPTSGLPVIVVPTGIISRQFNLPESDLSALSEKLPFGFRLMALRTVAGTKAAPVFTPDVITWNGKAVRAAITLSPSGNLPLALAPSCFAESGETANNPYENESGRRHA